MHFINEALPQRSASEKLPHRARAVHRWRTIALHAANPRSVTQHASISLSMHSPMLTHPGQGPFVRRGSRLPAVSDAAAPTTQPPPVVQAVLFGMDGVLGGSKDLSQPSAVELVRACRAAGLRTGVFSSADAKKVRVRTPQPPMITTVPCRRHLPAPHNVGGRGRPYCCQRGPPSITHFQEYSRQRCSATDAAEQPVACQAACHAEPLWQQPTLGACRWTPACVQLGWTRLRTLTPS